MPRKKAIRRVTKKTRKTRQDKVAQVMTEFKHRQLHSGSKQGPLVRNRRQAIAIALSVQRRADAGIRKRKPAARRKKCAHCGK